MKLEDWSGRRVLVTGHTGFKGAWLTLWLQHAEADVWGVALPPESPDGAYALMGPWAGLHERILDVRDGPAVHRAVNDAQPEVVFHLAAQALVRRGWADPVATYETNVIGTANVLRACEQVPSVRAVVVATSDKVYAAPGPVPSREDDRLGGADPYSASKACAELICAAMPAARPPRATARAGNVLGGGDRAADRLLPDLVRSHERRTAAHIRNPDSVRPWQYVLDAISGYLRLGEAVLGGQAPPAVNFGPSDVTTTVREVADLAVEILGAAPWVATPGDGPSEEPALRLDSSLAREALGWEPRLIVREAVDAAARWYVESAAGADMREYSIDTLRTWPEK